MVNIYESGASSADKQQIVLLHNQMRTMIMEGTLKGQPKGYNLTMLKWDDKLAEAAQKIANTGKYAHVDVKDSRFPVGQNLYRGMFTQKTSGPDWNRAVNSWFDEHKLYKFDTKYEPNIGHYTQLIWSDTKCVGCGYVHMDSGDKKFIFQKLYVCNYGPAGNYIGKHPYATKPN